MSLFSFPSSTAFTFQKATNTAQCLEMVQMASLFSKMKAKLRQQSQSLAKVNMALLREAFCPFSHTVSCTMLFAQQWWKFCAAHKTSQRGTRPAFEMDYYFQQLLYTSFVCSVFLLRRRRTTYTTETLKTVLVGESPRFFLHHQKNYLLRIVAISQINPRKRIVKNRKHEFWNINRIGFYHFWELCFDPGFFS